MRSPARTPIQSPLQRFDAMELRLTLRANALGRRRSLTRLFRVASRLGDGIAWYALLVFLWVIGPAGSEPAVLQIGLTALGGVLIYRVLKNGLMRERPYIAHRGIVPGTAPLDRYSFPSGHSMHAALFTAFVAVLAAPLLPLVLPFALAVAASRVILGLHYPSDVIAGVGIGLALASVSLALRTPSAIIGWAAS